MPARNAGTAQLVAILVIVILFWNTILLFPLKVFVVLLHEISHGLMAVLTGGSIVRIEVNANQGGVCWTSGGSRFLTLSAGYLGSMLFGAVLLVWAARSRKDRQICMGFGAFLLLMTLLYVRNGFGFALGLAAGGGLIAGAKLFSDAFADTTLKTIGATSCLYAILDIKSDILDRRVFGWSSTGGQSDADMLAELTRIPAFFWGLLWIGLSVVVTVVALRKAAHNEGGRA